VETVPSYRDFLHVRRVMGESVKERNQCLNVRDDAEREGLALQRS
jgi:hypothetical protein